MVLIEHSLQEEACRVGLEWASISALQRSLEEGVDFKRAAVETCKSSEIHPFYFATLD